MHLARFYLEMTSAPPRSSNDESRFSKSSSMLAVKLHGLRQLPTSKELMRLWTDGWHSSPSEPHSTRKLPHVELPSNCKVPPKH